MNQWSGFRPNVTTCPRKVPARSIHSSEEQHCGFSQTVTHPSTNAANCCLTSIVVTLAFHHSAIGKRQNSSGDLRTLSRISQCYTSFENNHIGHLPIYLDLHLHKHLHLHTINREKSGFFFYSY